MVRYLQLAHNERHPDTGNPVAKVIHSFGRAEQVDRAALARLVSSVSGTVDLTVFPAQHADGSRRGRCRDDNDTERHDREEEDGPHG